MLIDEWGKGAKYWEKTFNPVIGCKPISEGCDNCYARNVCQRYDMNGDGQFNPTPKPNAKPPKSGIVFVGNMTDLFGEWNSDAAIFDWLDSLDSRAINLILTKRPDRFKKIKGLDLLGIYQWLGITAENQKRLDERASLLMRTGAIRKWISLEPLLGPIHIAPWLLTTHQKRGFDTQYISPPFDWQYRDALKWVVVGAESLGNQAGRECKLEWIEEIVEDCKEWGCPVFVKQLHIGGKLEKDIAKFPKHLQIRQVPWGKES